MFSVFVFYLIRNHLYVLGFEKLGEDESVDVREVDILLSEIGVIFGRWSLYCGFLPRKCQKENILMLH